jgi:predicted acetyltransferase
MEIRELDENDYLESLKLSMYAFQYKVDEEKIPARLESLKEHKIIGVWEDSMLAAKLHILSFHVFMNGEKWKMGGLAGVATYPEFRRTGFVKELIIESLKEMHKSKQIVSLLAPFDFSFYRKFGWEVLSDKKKVMIEKSHLKFFEEQNGYIKRYNKQTHHKDIEVLYEKYSKQYSGMLVRETKWWLQNVYDDDSFIAVYYNGDHEASGYILYDVKERKMEVREWVTLNHEAKKGLWNFICQHDSMIERATLVLSSSDQLTYCFPHHKLKIELYPYFMARIVDVEECLKKFPFKGLTESLFLHIEDPFSPWNNGSYLIGNGELKVFREKQGSKCSHPPQKGIRLNINALSAILFGYKRPQELFELGLVTGPEKDVSVFEELIPSLKSTFFDFF